MAIIANDSWTPLHVASLKGNAETVKLLLENRATVDAKGARQGRDHQSCADTIIKAKDSWTPLHAASSMGHTEVVKLLLGGGADVTIAGARRS
jgi:uncharacterized protein